MYLHLSVILFIGRSAIPALDTHPCVKTPPGQTLPLDTPPPPGRHPLHSACWDTVKRAVRILLECILAGFRFSFLILMDATANSILKIPNQIKCMTITDGLNGHWSESIIGASKKIFPGAKSANMRDLTPVATWVGLWSFFLSRNWRR